ERHSRSSYRPECEESGEGHRSRQLHVRRAGSRVRTHRRSNFRTANQGDALAEAADARRGAVAQARLAQMLPSERRALEQGAVPPEHRPPDQFDRDRALLEKRVMKFAEDECGALLFAKV